MENKRKSRGRMDKKTIALCDICQILAVVSESLMHAYEEVNDAWQWAADEIPNRIEIPLPPGYEREKYI